MLGESERIRALQKNFAHWFKTIWPLVVVTSERLNEEGDGAKRKDDSDEESGSDYGEEVEVDSELASQDEETTKLSKKGKALRMGNKREQRKQQKGRRNERNRRRGMVQAI